MPFSSPQLPDPQHSLIIAYAQAQAAIERIEERRRLSPVRQPWRIRSLIAERQALARIDGLAIDDTDVQIDGRGMVGPSPYDLTHGRQAIGVPISLDALLHDGMALLEWLGISYSPISDNTSLAVARRTIPDMLIALDVWRRDAFALPPSPPLLHGAELARLWRIHAPLGRGDLVVSLLIGDRWGPGRWRGSAGGLVALGLERSHAPWQRAQGHDLGLIWLKAIANGAQLHLDQEIRLRAYAHRAAQHVAQRRRPGRLKDILLLAMARPRISSSLVARQLGLTSAGAIKLLTIATDAGLLIEQSGQASYRSYAIPVALPSASAPHGDELSKFEEFWADDAKNDTSPELH